VLQSRSAHLGQGKQDRPASLCPPGGVTRPSHPACGDRIGQIYHGDKATSARRSTQSGPTQRRHRERHRVSPSKRRTRWNVVRLHRGGCNKTPRERRLATPRTRLARLERRRRSASGTTAAGEYPGVRRASSRARGARLAPADQQSFSRDSSARARVERTRGRVGGAAAEQGGERPARRRIPAYGPAFEALR